MKAKVQQPWESHQGKGPFESHIQLAKNGCGKILIRIFGEGSFFPYEKYSNSIFSDDKRLDEYHIITIGSFKDGFRDPCLISKTLECVPIPSTIDEICVFFVMHHGPQEEYSEFVLWETKNIPIKQSDGSVLYYTDPHCIKAVDFFDQFIPLAKLINKPIDFVGLCCFGIYLHDTSLLSKFPDGTRLFTFSGDSMSTDNIFFDVYKLPTFPLSFKLLDQAVFITGLSLADNEYRLDPRLSAVSVPMLSVVKNSAIIPKLNEDIVNRYIKESSQDKVDNWFTQTVSKLDIPEFIAKLMRLKEHIAQKTPVMKAYGYANHKKEVMLKSQAAQAKFKEIIKTFEEHFTTFGRGSGFPVKTKLMLKDFGQSCGYEMAGDLKMCSPSQDDRIEVAMARTLSSIAKKYGEKDGFVMEDVYQDIYFLTGWAYGNVIENDVVCSGVEGEHAANVTGQ